MELFIKDMNHKGVNMWINAGDGCHELASDQLSEFLEDPDLFRGKLHRVSKENYLMWEAVMKHDYNLICAAKTSRGTQCKNLVFLNVRSPKMIDHQEIYCPFHRVRRRIEDSITPTNAPPTP